MMPSKPKKTTTPPVEKSVGKPVSKPMAGKPVETPKPSPMGPDKPKHC